MRSRQQRSTFWSWSYHDAIDAARLELGAQGFGLFALGEGADAKPVVNPSVGAEVGAHHPGGMGAEKVAVFLTARRQALSAWSIERNEASRTI